MSNVAFPDDNLNDESPDGAFSLDDELDRLLSGDLPAASVDDLDEPRRPVGGDPVPDEDFQLPDDFAIPDDLSGFDPETLTDKAKRELAILITRVAFPNALAAACALAEVAADVVGTEVGAIAILHDIDDEAPERAAAALTQVVRGIPALLVTKAEGQISVTEFADGADRGPLPPAVVLTSASELVEELIVGALKPSDVPGVVSSVGIGKMRALKMIADAAKPHRGHFGHGRRGTAGG